MALRVTPANGQDRAQVAQLAEAVQPATNERVEVAFVDQGYTGAEPAAAASEKGLRLEVVKHHEAKTVLYCCRAAGSWNVPLRGCRGSGRLARDYERLATTFNFGWLPLARLCLAYAQKCLWTKLITGSSSARGA